MSFGTVIRIKDLNIPISRVITSSEFKINLRNKSVSYKKRALSNTIKFLIIKGLDTLTQQGNHLKERERIINSAILKPNYLE